jgi:hypothetical protein
MFDHWTPGSCIIFFNNYLKFILIVLELQFYPLDKR